MKLRFGLAVILSGLLLLNLFSLNAKSKDGSISGTIEDSKNGAPIPFAKASLYKQKDSSLVTGAISEKDGSFEIENVKPGSYYMLITYMGYNRILVPGFKITDKIKNINLGTLKMSEGSVLTDEVTVTADKQTVEYTMDKKIINVEKNINSAGGSAVDILQTIPSITVDYDGNVSMRGSTNLTILIDGKPSAALSSNRNAVLEQIPASMIESVEIISNPSAKYNPEGTNGILNIVLKKQVNFGFNGVTNLSIGTNDKYSGSVNVNYGLGDVNLFGAYDIRSDRRAGYGNTNRDTYLPDSVYFIRQSFNMNRKGFDNSLRLGADFIINPKNSLTISSQYSYDTDTHTNLMTTNYLDSVKKLSGINTDRNKEDNFDNSFNAIFNYKMKFDKKDQALSADFVFNKNRYREGEDINQFFPFIDYLNADSAVHQNSLNEGNTINANIEVNYSEPLGKDSKYELGYQGIIRNFDNNYIFNNINDSTKVWTESSLLSNHFLYNENIHALYGTYGSKSGNFKYQLGLRFEQAWTRAEQKTSSQIFNNDYFSFYPSAHLSYDLQQENTLMLSYSRRVNRPGAWSLNPFRDVSNPINVMYGNPYLKPEYINSLELGNSKSWSNFTFITTIFYREIDNVIKRVTFLDSNGVTNNTSQNMAKGQSYGLELIADHTPFKWWKYNANFSYFRTLIKGSSNGSDLSNNNYSWTAKLNSTWTLWRNFNIQLNANYRGPIVTPQGVMKETYNIDIAMRKEFLNDKLSVGFRVSDVFNTMNFGTSTTGNDFSMIVNRKRETRVAYLTLTYKINSGIKPKEKRRGPDTFEDEGGNGGD